MASSRLRPLVVLASMSLLCFLYILMCEFTRSGIGMILLLYHHYFGMLQDFLHIWLTDTPDVDIRKSEPLEIKLFNC